MQIQEIIRSHVLVIGSGGAGVRAAIEASAAGTCVLISRTIVGKGGCTIMAEGGYNAVMNEEDNISDHFTDTMKGGAYLNDQDLVRVLTEEAPLRMNDLISWGAVFDVTDSCTICQRPFGGQCFPRTCYAGDRTGHEMMITLMERLSGTNVRICHEIAAFDLLVSEGRVIGALGLDRKGRLYTFLADATVLATGGGTRVFDISTNSTSGTGDGYAMGWRAGAELIDMEQIQFHPTGAVYPWDARGRLVTEAVRGEGGVLKNSLGERFMARYDPVKMELSTRDVVARACATEIMEGRGTPHGGVWLDVSHLPARQIEERLPVMLEQFLKYGVDIRTEPMEVAPTAHHIMGGLRIDPFCQTTLPGLYACGEVAGGVHGANRLGGNALAETQVFGARAGGSASKASVQNISATQDQVGAALSMMDGYLSGDVLPDVVKHELQTIMWRGAGIFRSKVVLEETKVGLDHLSRKKLKAVDPSGLIDCCITRNMIDTARLIVTAAILRDESRGAHVRTDIIQDWDNKNSPFGHTILTRTGATIERRRS
ncbi:fumarate reductase subunit A [Methanospirillum sp. J.3.6.1-F.2.7.3]|uniref:Fumarate reductase subunit A n=1 Tax=Methanospirillum purgamenti TaxID=2834276 RepID=A0A8E7B152_9EURY|nr:MULTISPECIES: fumarate reductase (CoM/CoB) subunit TfrA [Methanospirillum]MDX8549452.1 fumarate reductase (CoM/CoB) subunit TfrA [Methanospirillum hungatei]QVV90505.1 fumarate reductase subunit A [Methanospirillum sp. J.3.6.1-F.2.7.3]